MERYITRKAKKEDIYFLADIVIAADKGNSNKLSYSTLFNLSENEVKTNIIAMFEAEIDGCEFSISSYYVTEYNGEVVAGFGAWIEGYQGCLPSKILKSNLIFSVFSKDSINFFKDKSYIIKDIVSEREPLSLQLEHLFITDEHQGKRIANVLINTLEENALSINPLLKKVQFQLFKNNIHVVRLFENHGYNVVRSLKSNNPEIRNYLPFDEKYIMEKTLIK